MTDDVPSVAEPGQRLVARIVDTLIVGIPVVTLTSWAAGGSTSAAVPITLACALFLYDAVQFALWGRTLGKRVARIRVVSAATGEPIDPRQAAVRAAIYAAPIAFRSVGLLAIIVGLFWLFEVGLLLERPLRQALHDRAAGTVVIGA
jgi:uncharacterized RDD family membrane protein YckC